MNNSGNSKRVLLLVHGRDFKPGANDFADLSISALTMGIERDCAEVADQFNALDKRLAYYGDISNEFLAGKGLRYDETLDIGDRRNALIKIRALEKKKNFSVTRYDRLPGKSALSEFFADTVAPLAGGIGLSSLLMRKVGADLSEYWSAKSDFAEKLRERVRSSICDALDDGSLLLLTPESNGVDRIVGIVHSPPRTSRYDTPSVPEVCAIHALYGEASKPAFCREFPFSLTRDPRGLTAVAISCQDFAAGSRGDCGGVALARGADGGVAGDAALVGGAQGSALCLGLATIRALMHMDLHRGEVPPGGPFPGLDQGDQGFEK